MQRLEELSTHPFLLKWVHNYLWNRKQQVVVGGYTSEQTSAISSVPQGSVLGPLLFLIYIDRITAVSLSKGRKLSLYADDMVLYKSITSNSDIVNLQDIDWIFWLVLH